MRKPVLLRARADADIDSALEHCAREAPHGAKGLLAALQVTLGAIARFPALGSPRYAHELDLPGLRCRATKGFPYIVFYVERSADIVVVRVLHQRRDISVDVSE